MTNPANIPTLAETTELAVDVSLVIGAYVQIRGNTFRVVQWANELRFFQRSGMRWLGVNGDSVHVEILRGDLVRAATLPGGYRNAELEADCVAIVKAALVQVAGPAPEEIAADMLEEFCACGRVVSMCDGSRRACKSRMVCVRVDWLGHATHDDGRTGYLITGPYKGVYVLRLDGSTVNIPANKVAIQRTGAGAFEVYEGTP